MLPKHKPYVKLLVPLLPILGELTSSAKGLFVGLSVVSVFLIMTHLFKILQPLFPQKLFKSAVVLFFAVLFQIGLYLQVSVLPFWFLSLWALWDWKDFLPGNLGSKNIPPLRRALIFVSGAVSLSFVREIFSTQAGLRIFEQPAGMLFLLGVFLLVVLQLDPPARFLLNKKRRRV